MDKKLTLKCLKCQKKYPLEPGILTCPDHSPYYGYLAIEYDYSLETFPIKNSHAWGKYLPLLPLEDFKIHFNEGKTPLVRAEQFGAHLGLKNLYIKDESKNPTGSFKDKESAIAVNKAVEWAIKEVFVVSSGNAAVSTAAYAKKAGISCFCLVPKKTSVGKRFLISLYGGKLKEVDGPYETIYRMVIDNPPPGWNCTPGINPLKDEGVKIIGFEIWEDIGVPDVVVVPCGNGTLLFGIYKSFAELKTLGKIKKLPKMVGVQIKNAAPLKLALEQGKDFVALNNAPESVAEGIVALESYSSPKTMKALKETNGEIIEVGDQEIQQAMKEVISTESLLPEPTAAAAFAGLKKIKVDPESKIVCVLTAGGQKNLKEIMEGYIS